MTKEQPTFVLSEDAEMALSSLGDDDRRRVSALLNHLHNGRDDAFVRENSLAVATMDYHYVLKWGGWLIFFQQTEGIVTVLSVHRQDVLKAFQLAAKANG